MCQPRRRKYCWVVGVRYIAAVAVTIAKIDENECGRQKENKQQTTAQWNLLINDTFIFTNVAPAVNYNHQGCEKSSWYLHKTLGRSLMMFFFSCANIHIHTIRLNFLFRLVVFFSNFPFTLVCLSNEPSFYRESFKKFLRAFFFFFSMWNLSQIWLYKKNCCLSQLAL